MTHNSAMLHNTPGVRRVRSGAFPKCTCQSEGIGEEWGRGGRRMGKRMKEMGKRMKEDGEEDEGGWGRGGKAVKEVNHLHGNI